ncbi:TRAM domain-containing protein [Halorubrum amylolyticum]|uniref:TRAM domain-containing protein n=1 Tax=Halorubrum amylolyticum TaxID=2508724 RepID=UPI0010093183
MEISESLLTLYSATVEQRDGKSSISVPTREIEKGNLEAGETYRVALLPTPSSASTTTEPPEPQPEASTESNQSPTPPVTAGDRREVEIENIGDQGDGIAKIDRGYVVIVPDTDVGDRVTVEIEDAQANVGFATVVDRNPRGPQ